MKDYDVAINSAYQIIAYSEFDANKLNNLAKLYIKINKLNQALAICNEVLLKEKSNIVALQLTSLIFGEQNQLASKKYVDTELYKLTNNKKYLYEIGEFYFSQNEYQNAINTLTLIINDTLSKNEAIEIKYPNKLNQTETQIVSLYSASNNLIGFILYTNGQYEEAISFFEKALEQNKNYVLALNNLNLCKNKLREKTDKK